MDLGIKWDQRSLVLRREPRQIIMYSRYDFTLIHWYLLSRSSAHRLNLLCSFHVSLFHFLRIVTAWNKAYARTLVLPSAQPRPKGRGFGFDSGARTQMVHAFLVRSNKLACPGGFRRKLNLPSTGYKLWDLGCGLVLTDKL